MFHSDLPGSYETGVGFHQVVGDVPVRQIQHGVPRGLHSLARGQASGADGTDGHHGQLLPVAALAGRRRVPLGPLRALQDVAHHGGDVGILPVRGAVAAGHPGGRGADRNEISLGRR